MRILTVILFIFLFATGFATNEQWTSYISVANLCNGLHRDIVADDNGNVWFTGTALSKYSSSTDAWTLYSDSLVWDWTICIAIDNSNNKWIGTYQGISMMDAEGNWISYTVDDSGLGDNWIQSVAIDSSEVKWFGTHGGVSSFDGTTWTTYTSTDGLAADTVNAIAVDKDNNKWFATSRGVSKFDGTTWTNYTTANTLPGNEINDLVIDSIGNFWIGTNNGLVKYDGSVWITYTTEDGMASDSVISIASKAETIWVGFGRNTQKKGAAKFDGSTWTNYRVFDESDRASSPSVPALAIDSNGEIWFASLGEAVFRFTKTGVRKHYVRTTHMYDDTKYTAATDADGFYNWFGSNDGLSKIAKGGNLMKYTAEGTPTLITDITIDNYGNAKWFATLQGLYYLSATWGTWTTYTTDDGLPSNNLTAIMIDYEGNKWIGTENSGVCVYNDITWTTYTTDDGLASNTITDIIVDANGDKWFATEASGVSFFDGSKWTNYTTDDGLISNNIICAALDIDGSLWFGTDAGISKYDGSTWTSYTTDDGLLTNPVTVIKIDKAGVKWIGMYGRTESGMSKFDGTTWTNYTCENSVDEMINIRSITIDGDGNKWIGAGDGSIIYLEDEGALAYTGAKTRVTGLLFNDANENGVMDSDESGTGFDKHVIQVDESYTTTYNDGYFTVLLDEGTHEFTYVPQKYWEMTVTDPISLTVSDASTPDTVFIGIHATEDIHDVSVTATTSRARVWGTSKYWINYINEGSVTENGTVSMQLDSLISDMQTFSIEPDSTNENYLAWNFEELAPQEQIQITFYAVMPDLNYVGDTLISLVNIAINNTDIDEDNNLYSLEQQLVSSYDPNDKQVEQGEGDENYVLHDTKLDYTIRFQNTGTDTAYTVCVVDTISTSMDMATLQLESVSHTVTMQIKDGRAVVFSFTDIDLPPLTTDEPASNGYVSFSISPVSGLADNTEVTNSAAIYFDQNPAVETNEVFNTFVSVIPGTETGIVTCTDNGTKIYPNPTKNGIMVEVSESTVLTIYTMNGQCVLTAKMDETSYFLPLDILPKGAYVLKTQNTKGMISEKLIKE